MRKQDIKLYNVLFPLWMLMLFPATWLVIIPGNFIIDSIVLLISIGALKITEKKQWYKKHILPVFGFGFLADLTGAGLMLLALAIFDVDLSRYEFLLTVPGVIITAGLIFVANYFVTFRKAEKSIRLKSALFFAIFTAPYTFLIPTAWLY